MKNGTRIALFGLLLAMALMGCAEDDKKTSGEEGGGAGATSTDTGAAGSSGSADSVGAAAMCTTGDDCPAGIECVLPAGGSVGFCNVSDMVVDGAGDEAQGDEAQGEPSDGISLGAPAPCETDEDCGAFTCTKAFDDELGFCDVTEMQAEP